MVGDSDDAAPDGADEHAGAGVYKYIAPTVLSGGPAVGWGDGSASVFMGGGINARAKLSPHRVMD